MHLFRINNFRLGPTTVAQGLLSLLVILSGIGLAYAHTASVTRSQIQLDHHFTYESAAHSTSFLLDSSQKMDLQDVIQANKWKQMDRGYTNFGFTQDHLWLRLTLHNEGPKQTYITRLEYPLLDHIQFYQPDADGQYFALETGDQLPFSSRPLKDRYFSFPVELDSGQSKTLYWRINSRDTLIVPLTVATQDAYETDQLHSMMLFGMYYGAILVILFINSFLFFFLRQKAQVYYVALLANYAIVELSLNGTGNVYLWGDIPEFTKFVRPFAIGLLSILTVKLTKSYFELRTLRLGRINVEPLIIIVGVTAMITSLLVPFSWAIQISMLAMVIVTPYVLTVALYQLYLRKNAARYYITGWIGFLVGGLLNILRAFDLIEVSFISTYGSQIGSLFTLVILNMGLTNQFREFQRNSEQSKERIIRQQEVLNKQLDHAVTERTQELEAQKQEADNARMIAEQALATKSQFLATMSHEIRTPMNGVLGITQILMDTPLNGHQRHLIRTIKHSGDTLVSIINDILDYSKIEAGKLSTEKIELNLRNLLDECIELFSCATAEKQIRLILSVTPETPITVMGDPTRLRQIIINLLGNAVKFTDKGYVALKAHFDKSHSQLRITIIDTGIGISDEQQQKLFQSFSQADSSTTRKFGGTGLGLAISKSLTQLMGGCIGLKSTTGKGSEFWLELPCKAIIYPEPNPALKGKQILILDPLPAAVNGVAAALTAYGVITFTERDEFSPERLDLVIQHLHQPASLRRFSCPTLILRPLQEAAPNNAANIQDPCTHSQLIQAVLRQLTGREQPVTSRYEVTDFSDLKVLVAEDNAVNQMVVKGLLKKFNIVPDLANDGLEAIHCVQSAPEPYDLILMDCEMPNLDGYQATTQLRHLPQCSHTRIVGLSAHAMQEHREAGLKAGMNDFLTKPLAIETLAEELAITCSLRPVDSLPK